MTPDRAPAGAGRQGRQAAVVKGLAHPDFLVEIDAIAVVPA
jgi:enamine deaminase RidA (YjgF/YER057c/UK114 family)